MTRSESLEIIVSQLEKGVKALAADIFQTRHYASATFFDEMLANTWDGAWPIHTILADIQATLSLLAKDKGIATSSRRNASFKFAYRSLGKIAVLLEKENRLKEAIEASKLSCKASWKYVVAHCNDDDVSENTIADLVTEASEILVSLVAFLEFNQDGMSEINGIITESLVCWSDANNLIATLPTPVPLVKKWVEMQRKLSKESEDGELLYSLLSSTKGISKNTLGKLLEEELVAYDCYLDLKFCRDRRMEVIKILLEEIYVTNDSILKKCRFLIEKAKSLRASGSKCVDGCLLDAISALESIYNKETSCCYQVHHLLIDAHILRAFWTQEAKPDSMYLSPKSDFRHCIDGALKLCMEPNHEHAGEENEDMLYLWELKPLVVGFQKISEIKQSVSNVISSGPLTNSSIFLLSNLYYDLPGTLISNGRMIESSGNYEDCALTPWNVLSCYLESIIQVGYVHEILGDAREAEKGLMWGRNVAQFLRLPLFEISFSCALGTKNILQKKASENELSNAKRTLTNNLATISCKKCSSMFEVTIDQQLGDLSSSRCIEESDFKKRLSNAESLYKSALDKLNLCDWRASYSIFESGDIQVGPASEHLSTAAVGSDHDVTKSFQSQLDLLLSICLLLLMKCLQCLRSGCSNLKSFMCMNWVFVHRKLCLRLLISIGKFSGTFFHVREGHDILQQLRNSFCSKHSSESLGYLIKIIGKQLPGQTVLAPELAALLYYFCWFTINFFQGTREIVPILKLSFILSQDIPLLFQKISRLLAIIYTLSSSLDKFYLSPNDQGFESMWATFYYQASISTLLNQQVLYATAQKKHSQNSKNYKARHQFLATSDKDMSTTPKLQNRCSKEVVPEKDSSGLRITYYSLHLHFKGSSSGILDLPRDLRPAPESCEHLQEFVQKFFQALPSSAVICISLVSGADSSLLKGLLEDCSPEVGVWILLSHLSSDAQHVILLPVHDVLKGDASDDKASLIVYKSGDVAKWKCPWGSSASDDIAPVFRDAMEELHCSFQGYEVAGDRRFLEFARKVDKCLEHFLYKMENLWLGNWKCVLLGKWPDRNCLGSLQASLSNEKEDHLQCVVSKNCYVGKRSEATSDDLENMLGMSDKPIILVLDIDVQMLPWESMPLLRKKEVYRMPSIGSIFATFDRCCQNEEKIPFIDPLNSYYLLNPDGDLSLSKMENDFKNLLKVQKIKGMTGSPSFVELSRELRDRDLFIYAGHGTGRRFIPWLEIEKLEGCAAAVLFGCSSGCLKLQGKYMPDGAPLSYLLAGSPFIVASLWDLKTDECSKFGRQLLSAWFKKRSDSEYTHRPRIASFMGKARSACKHKFITGAAAVCYGVPTEIMKK
ncbi:hypothetical protein OROHE_004938 [Orobanche hederae]